MLNPRPKKALQAFVYKQYLLWILQGLSRISPYARERMDQLGLPGATHVRQAPEADGTAPMFASERQILAALIAQLGNDGSDTMALIEGIVTRSCRDIAEEVADAVAARAEIG